MQVASRSYMSTGVALVGAGAIAVAPLALPTPDVQIPAPSLSSAAVELSAAANPLEQWVQVLGTAFANVSDRGEQWQADPAPLLMQLVANQMLSANVLSESAKKLTEGLATTLSPENPYGFTVTVQSALDQIAAGDFETGLSALASSFLLLGLPLLDVMGNQWVPGAWSVVAQPFTNLAKLVNHLPDELPALLANGLIGPQVGTSAAAGKVLEDLVSNAQSGDFASFANTLASAPATITDALLNGYTVADFPASGLLGGGFDQNSSTVGAVMNMLKGLADTIATPGANRHDVLGGASALPSLGVAPEAKVAADPGLDSSTKLVKVDLDQVKELSVKSDALQAKSELGDAAPKATQDKVDSGAAKRPLKTVRDGLNKAVGNVTDGLKKVTGGLTAKKESPKSTAGSAGSEAN